MGEGEEEVDCEKSLAEGWRQGKMGVKVE
jgi:hypothetical protein